jgi:hypothetical protein
MALAGWLFLETHEMKTWHIMLLLVLVGGGAAFYFLYWKKRKGATPTRAEQMDPTFTPQPAKTVAKAMPTGQPKAISATKYIDNLSKSVTKQVTQTANKVVSQVANAAQKKVEDAANSAIGNLLNSWSL